MARDLSIQPVNPSPSQPTAQQSSLVPHGDRPVPHQHRGGARTPSPDRLGYSTSESEGDGGGDSDDSFDHVDEQGVVNQVNSECNGL